MFRICHLFLTRSRSHWCLSDVKGVSCLETLMLNTGTQPHTHTHTHTNETKNKTQ